MDPERVKAFFQGVDNSRKPGVPGVTGDPLPRDAAAKDHIKKFAIPLFRARGIPLVHVDAFVDKLLDDTNGPVDQVMREVLTRRATAVNEVTKTRGRLVAKVTDVLTTDQQTRLWSQYPEVEWKPSLNTTSSSHSAAAVARQVDTDLLLRQAGVGVDIVDVGGNWFTHISRGRTTVHSCCPLTNARDRARHDDRLEKFRGRLAAAVSGRLKGDTAVLRDAAANPARYYCNRLSQECNVQAPVGLSVHSAYDIKMTDWPLIMDAHGMKVVHGAMILPMGVADSKCTGGVVEHLGCHYTIDRTRGVVAFFFDGDNSLAYEHDLEELKKYARPRVLRKGKDAFYYTPTVVREGSIMFSVHRVKDAAELPASHTSEKYAVCGDRKFVRVKSYVVERTYRRDSMFSLKPVEFSMPKENWNACVSEAVAQGESRLTRRYVHQYMRSYNYRFVINGVSVVAADKVPAEVFEAATIAVYMYALRLLAKTSLTIKKFIKDEMKVRAVAGAGFPSISGTASVLYDLVSDGLSSITPLTMFRDLRNDACQAAFLVDVQPDQRLDKILLDDEEVACGATQGGSGESPSPRLPPVPEFKSAEDFLAHISSPVVMDALEGALERTRRFRQLEKFRQMRTLGKFERPVAGDADGSPSPTVCGGSEVGGEDVPERETSGLRGKPTADERKFEANGSDATDESPAEEPGVASAEEPATPKPEAASGRSEENRSAKKKGKEPAKPVVDVQSFLNRVVADEKQESSGASQEHAAPAYFGSAVPSSSRHDPTSDSKSPEVESFDWAEDVAANESAAPQEQTDENEFAADDQADQTTELPSEAKQRQSVVDGRGRVNVSRAWRRYDNNFIIAGADKTLDEVIKDTHSRVQGQPEPIELWAADHVETVGVKSGYISRAVGECIRYYLYAHDAVMEDVRRVADLTWTGSRYDYHSLMKHHSTDDRANYLRIIDGKVVDMAVETTETYTAAYDPVTDRLISMYVKPGATTMLGASTANNCGLPHSSYLLVVAGFSVFNSLSLARSMRFVRPEMFEQQPEIKLYEGVPGCGKTTYVVNRFTEDDLILCQTRSTVEEIREKLADKGKVSAVSHVRTVDSYLLANYRRKFKRSNPVKVLYVDEALMVHAGQVYSAIAFSKPERVVVLGDTNQIPFINRYTTFRTVFQRLGFLTSREYNNVTRRCPVDVCAALFPYYAKGIYCKARRPDGSVVMNSMEKKVLTTVNSIRAAGTYDVYLTFTQFEKYLLERAGVKNAFTVHEVQGKNFERVALVRLMTKHSDIYNSEPHCIVAISRHTVKFDYLSSDETDDLVTRMIMRSKDQSLRREVMRDV